MMKEQFMKPRGHFKIEALDENDNVVDMFEDKNLVMDLARPSMALMAGNVTLDNDAARSPTVPPIGATDPSNPPPYHPWIAEPINKFVLGTQGHRIEGGCEKYPEPKQPNVTPAPGDDPDNYYDSTRYELFSERNDLGSYHFDLEFTPDGLSDDNFDVRGKFFEKRSPMAGKSIDADTPDSKSNIQRVVIDRTVTYTITIPRGAGNPHSNNPPAFTFSEAALYCGPRIFSMKTFPARFKDDSVKLIITWSIIF